MAVKRFVRTMIVLLGRNVFEASAQVLGNSGFLSCEPWFLVLCLRTLGQTVFPTSFLVVGVSPGNLAKNLDGGCCEGAN